MVTLVLGLVLLLGVHSVSIVASGWRDAMVARIGVLSFKAAYSVVALVGLVLVANGYAAARLDPTVLYLPAAWLRHVAFALLIPVFPLLLATYFPGRIKRAAKHPTLLAVKLWALAHLLVNGSLADLILFGGFLGWAVADRVSMKRRADRPLPALAASSVNDLVAVVGGLGLYAAFAVWLHPMLIGVAVVG